MITKIKLHKTASYADIVEIEPKSINYFFGSNGTGKSSLGKVIADISTYPNCNLVWKAFPIDVFIYNKQFVKDSFSLSNAIKGIFTLGKDATDVQKFIEEANLRIGELNTKIDGLENSKTKQTENLSAKQVELEEKAWALKKKYEVDFKPAFKGFMGSAKDFLTNVFPNKTTLLIYLMKKKLLKKVKRFLAMI